jgi:hypothetical protein
MIELLISCVLTLPISTDTLEDYVICQDVKQKVEHVEEWIPTVSTYFKQEDIVKAMTIIYCESSGRDTAYNDKNKNGSNDLGLWQFNNLTWNWLSNKLSIKDNRVNPVVSTRVASWLVYNDGWHHWNSSKECWKNAEHIYRPKRNKNMGSTAS